MNLIDAFRFDLARTKLNSTVISQRNLGNNQDYAYNQSYEQNIGLDLLIEQNYANTEPNHKNLNYDEFYCIFINNLHLFIQDSYQYEQPQRNAIQNYQHIARSHKWKSDHCRIHQHRIQIKRPLIDLL